MADDTELPDLRPDDPMQDSSNSHLTLMSIPAELRGNIVEYVFADSCVTIPRLRSADNTKMRKCEDHICQGMSIIQVSHQLRAEALQKLEEVTYVKIPLNHLIVNPLLSTLIPTRLIALTRRVILYNGDYAQSIDLFSGVKIRALRKFPSLKYLDLDLYCHVLGAPLDIFRSIHPGRTFSVDENDVLVDLAERVTFPLGRDTFKKNLGASKKMKIDGSLTFTYPLGEPYAKVDFSTGSITRVRAEYTL